MLLGLPSLRLPGFYFAMATLAFGLIVSELALAEQWLTNGSVGMPAPSFPAPFDTPWGFYWLVLGIAAFITWMTANLARLMWGRAMVALRDSTVAASSVAVPIYSTKLMVFVFSGFTAGISGGLYATSQSYITPDAFIVNLGIYFFVAIIIGGRGVIIGPFIGAAVLAAIPELVGPLAKYGTFFYGFILLIVVLVLPGGFGELITNLAAQAAPRTAGLRQHRARSRSAARRRFGGRAMSDSSRGPRRHQALRRPDRRGRRFARTAPGRGAWPDRSERQRQDHAAEFDLRLLSDR